MIVIFTEAAINSRKECLISFRVEAKMAKIKIQIPMAISLLLNKSVIHDLSSIFLDDPDFLFREIVEIVNETVDPAVGGVDLALEVGLFVFRPGGGELPVESKHLFDQGDHPVVPLPVRRVGEVDGADGEL